MTTATKELQLHEINENRVVANFTVEPLSGDCIHVDARCIPGRDDRRSMTVNGVELEFWGRFYKQKYGLWDWIDYDGHVGYTLQKPWEANHKFEDASRAAVKKVRLIMIHFIEKWVRTEAAYQALCKAEIKTLTQQRKTKKSDLENAKLTVKRIEGEIEELTTKLASVK